MTTTMNTTTKRIGRDLLSRQDIATLRTWRAETEDEEVRELIDDELATRYCGETPNPDLARPCAVCGCAERMIGRAAFVCEPCAVSDAADASDAALLARLTNAELEAWHDEAGQAGDLDTCLLLEVEQEARFAKWLRPALRIPLDGDEAADDGKVDIYRDPDGPVCKAIEQLAIARAITILREARRALSAATKPRDLETGRLATRERALDEAIAYCDRCDELDRERRKTWRLVSGRAPGTAYLELGDERTATMDVDDAKDLRHLLADGYPMHEALGVLGLTHDRDGKA